MNGITGQSWAWTWNLPREASGTMDLEARMLVASWALICLIAGILFSLEAELLK